MQAGEAMDGGDKVAQELEELWQVLRQHEGYRPGKEADAVQALLKEADWTVARQRYRQSGASPFERLPAEAVESIVHYLADQVDKSEFKRYALVSQKMAQEVRRLRWRQQDASHASRSAIKVLCALAPTVGVFIKSFSCNNLLVGPVLGHLSHLKHLRVGIVERHTGGDAPLKIGETLLNAHLDGLLSFELYNYQLAPRDHEAETDRAGVAMKRCVLPLVEPLRTWKGLKRVVIDCTTSRATHRALLRAVAELPLLEELAVSASCTSYRKHPPHPSALFDRNDKTCFPSLKVFRSAICDFDEMLTVGAMRLLGSSVELIELNNLKLRGFRQPSMQEEAESSSDSDGDVSRRQRRNETQRSRVWHPILPLKDRLTGLTTLRIVNMPLHVDLRPVLECFVGLPLTTLEIGIHSLYADVGQEGGITQELASFAPQCPRLQTIRFLTKFPPPPRKTSRFDGLVFSTENTSTSRHASRVKKLRKALEMLPHLVVEIEDEDQYIETLPKPRRSANPFAGMNAQQITAAAAGSATAFHALFDVENDEQLTAADLDGLFPVDGAGPLGANAAAAQPFAWLFG